MKYVFVLGAKDPEMDRIEVLTRNFVSIWWNGGSCQWATAYGKPVHVGNAYSVDTPPAGENETFVWVECRDRKNSGGVVIDHHRQGDPGFGLGPADFWQASSLGQIYNLLGLGEPPLEDKVLAAMDHCFSAAVRGECPGVGGYEVLTLKQEEIGRATNSDPEEVRFQVSVPAVQP